MPRVKIIYTNSYDTDYDSYTAKEIVMEGTDWEEVTNEELTMLAHHVHKLPKPLPNYTPRLIIEYQDIVREALPKVKEMAEKLKRDLAAENKRREDKRKQKAKTKLEQRRAEFERLKKEFENA